MENTKIVYQCVRFSKEEAKKVFDLVANYQSFLPCKKEELHATFKFYGFKKPVAFGEEGVFPMEWVKEKKAIQFYVKTVATEVEDGVGIIQGVFLEPHPDAKDVVDTYYLNENPLHLTISFQEGIAPVRTGKIPEHFKKEMRNEIGEPLLITGFADVFTKNGKFLS